MRGAKIPHETIRRLPLYWRAVNFISAENHAHVNSKVLADVVHIKPMADKKNRHCPVSPLLPQKKDIAVDRRKQMEMMNFREIRKAFLDYLQERGVKY